MKEKLWGLKKDQVDRYINKMMSEFQFELQKLEFELITIEKEKERWQEQIQEEEKKQLVFSEKDVYWQTAHARLQDTIELMKHQTEKEEGALRQASKENVAALQNEIKRLDAEMLAINGLIAQFLNQLSHNPYEHASNQQAIESPVTVQPEAAEERELPHAGNEVSEEKMDSIKSAYILGKVTGTDLFDKRGQLLVPANTEITQDIVKKANEEGKLAELIVNMKVIGFGEE